MLGLVSAQRAETKCGSSLHFMKIQRIATLVWTKGISYCYSYLLVCSNWFLRNLVITPHSY